MKEIEALLKLNACSDAINYLKTQPDFETAWQNCQRGDWMLWLVGKLSGDTESDSRRKLVLTACKCARRWLRYFEEKYPRDARPRIAIETAEKWASRDVNITLADVKKAYDDDYDAYAYAYAYATAYAAAADTAVGTGVASRYYTLAQCADIVRQNYDVPKLN